MPGGGNLYGMRDACRLGSRRHGRFGPSSVPHAGLRRVENLRYAWRSVVALRVDWATAGIGVGASVGRSGIRIANYRNRAAVSFYKMLMANW
jgi:hypothetical protein